MQAAQSSKEVRYLKALTPDQVDRFWTDGFLSIGKLLTDEEIDLYRTEYDREFERARAGLGRFRNIAIDDADDLEAKNRADTQMLQIMQMCERNLHFRELLYEPRILDMMEDLLGPNLQLFHDQALFKPAHHGGPVPWHQDNAYWKCSPPNLISCWLTLDDVNIHNGAMQFIPGTHFQAVEHDRTADTNALLVLGERVDDARAVVVDLPAGGVTLHHCQTLHHTGPNVTERQRRAFAIHYMTLGTKRPTTGEYIEVSFSHPVLRMRA